MKILLIALLLFSSITWAALPHYPEFTWTPPTTFTNGEALIPGVDLQHYKMYCTDPLSIELEIPNDVTAYTAPSGTFPGGDYSCAMSSVPVAGGESDLSDAVNFTVDLRKPGRIVNFGAL